MVLACLCGLVVAALLLLEDGTAMGSPALTKAGADAAIVMAAAVCAVAVVRLFFTR